LAIEPISIIALIALTIISLSLLITTDWRISILLLSLQYVAVFLMVLISWPLQMAVIKLVAGWMAGAVLGMAVISAPTVRQRLESRPQSGEEGSRASAWSSFIQTGRPFQLLAAGLVGLSVFYLAPQIVQWIPEIGIVPALGGLTLIGMGLLKLGFNDQPLMIILGLLTVLAGFEIIYSILEISALVAGLLAVITLGLALVGAYLLTAPDMEGIE
jgi:hypothetical protein